MEFFILRQCASVDRWQDSLCVSFRNNLSMSLHILSPLPFIDIYVNNVPGSGFPSFMDKFGPDFTIFLPLYPSVASSNILWHLPHSNPSSFKRFLILLINRVSLQQERMSFLNKFATEKLLFTLLCGHPLVNVYCGKLLFPGNFHSLNCICLCA